MSLSFRPLIFPAKAKLTVQRVSQSVQSLLIDGAQASLPVDSVFTATKSPHAMYSIRLWDYHPAVPYTRRRDSFEASSGHELHTAGKSGED